MKKTNEKGITLVTLIITIIILLILLGVAVDIHFKTDDSIFEKAGQVVDSIHNQDEEVSSIKDQVRNQIEN